MEYVDIEDVCIYFEAYTIHVRTTVSYNISLHPNTQYCTVECTLYSKDQLAFSLSFNLNNTVKLF